MIIYASSENNTSLCIRVVWHSKTPSFASTNVSIIKYSDSTGSVIENRLSCSVSYTSQWQRAIDLEPGFYEIESVMPVNCWQERIEGHSEIFEVQPGKNYVYVGLAPSGESFVLPDPWIIHGDESRGFWIWGGTEEEDTEPDKKWDEYLDDLFGEQDKDTKTEPIEDDIKDDSKKQDNELNTDTKDKNEPSVSKKQNKISILLLPVVTVVMIIAIICCVIYLIVKKRRA